MASLLEKTRDITSILKRSEEKLAEELPYNAIAEHLSEIIHCNACIINSEGEVLGYHLRYKLHNDRVEEFFTSKQFPSEYIKAAAQVYDTQANISADSDLTAIPVESRAEYPNSVTTLAPIHVTGIRFGSLMILVEIASTVVGIQLLNFQREEDEKNIRRRAAVNMAVNTLSYSEMKAVSAILGELNGLEGQLTASVIADRIGITRSVIVNALRKLESAGIIESRSLGMKGTYLKVLIPAIFDEIKKRDY